MTSKHLTQQLIKQYNYEKENKNNIMEIKFKNLNYEQWLDVEEQISNLENCSLNDIENDLQNGRNIDNSYWFDENVDGSITVIHK